MNVKNFIKKIDELKSKSDLDISLWEDLSIALMNLVSLEEHCFFSYVKTNDDKFLQILNIVRELRKKLLALIVKEDGGSEKWCMSKHFLASSMRLYEIGNRLLSDKKEKEAKQMYQDASELYGLFWELNISSKNKIKLENKNEKTERVFSSIKNFLECCRE